MDLKPENLILDYANNYRLVMLDIGMNDFIDKERYFKVKRGAVNILFINIPIFSLTITHQRSSKRSFKAPATSGVVES